MGSGLFVSAVTRRGLSKEMSKVVKASFFFCVIEFSKVLLCSLFFKILFFGEVMLPLNFSRISKLKFVGLKEACKAAGLSVFGRLVAGSSVL